MHAKQKSGRKNDKNGTDDPMQLPDPFSVRLTTTSNVVAYKKRATKSLNNQRDQLVSENIF